MSLIDALSPAPRPAPVRRLSDRTLERLLTIVLALLSAGGVAMFASNLMAPGWLAHGGIWMFVVPYPLLATFGAVAQLALIRRRRAARLVALESALVAREATAPTR